MATIREYFDRSGNGIQVNRNWDWKDPNGATVATIIAKLSYDLDANARYWHIYFPSEIEPHEGVRGLLENDCFCKGMLGENGDSFFGETGVPGYSQRVSTRTLVFTRRVNLFVDNLLPENHRRIISGAFEKRGFFPFVLDREYAARRAESEVPLAFISHDSNDKDSLVRELAVKLEALGCPVWYDEFSLKVGDSLRQSIEKGLKQAKKCILILSPSFLENGGWGKAEFDSVFTREILERNNVILPVWHGVEVGDVYEYSPRLADKVGLKSSEGVDTLAKKLESAIRHS